VLGRWHVSCFGNAERQRERSMMDNALASIKDLQAAAEQQRIDAALREAALREEILSGLRRQQGGRLACTTAFMQAAAGLQEVGLRWLVVLWRERTAAHCYYIQQVDLHRNFAEVLTHERDAIRERLHAERSRCEEVRAQLDTERERLSDLASDYHKVHKAAIVDISFLSNESQRLTAEKDAAEQEVFLKTQALTHVHATRAQAVEQLAAQKAAYARRKREDARMKTLYDDAVTALEKEAGHACDVRQGLLRCHYMVLKAFSMLSRAVLQERGAEEKATKDDATEGAEDEDEDEALPVGLRIKSSLDVLQLDQRLLDKINFWLKGVVRQREVLSVGGVQGRALASPIGLPTSPQGRRSLLSPVEAFEGGRSQSPVVVPMARTVVDCHRPNKNASKSRPHTASGFY